VTPRRDARAEDAGVGLVELLVAVVIMGLVGGSIVSVAVASFRTERTVVEARAAMDEARLAVERLRRDIRESRRVLVGSTATTLGLWIDGDRDAVVDAGETITYRLVADVPGPTPCDAPTAGTARLTRQVDAGAQTTLGCAFLVGPAFAYAGTPVRSVTLSLTAEARTDDRGSSTVEVDDVIRVRNVQ
jgi:type II secretory pathway pseudopilin PulG